MVSPSVEVSTGYTLCVLQEDLPAPDFLAEEPAVGGGQEMPRILPGPDSTCKGTSYLGPLSASVSPF